MRMRGALRVTLSCCATVQNSSASNPLQIIVLPPERMGVHGFIMAPPTWKRRIISTGYAQFQLCQ